MDIERVNIVFNYDMPEDSDTYLHRVARAGRFGTKASISLMWEWSSDPELSTNAFVSVQGLAITFVSDEQDAKILNEVQDRFDVNITELPDEIDLSSYSKFAVNLPWASFFLLAWKVVTSNVRSVEGLFLAGFSAGGAVVCRPGPIHFEESRIL